jgi:ADP-ribosylglycohydrolase
MIYKNNSLLALACGDSYGSHYEMEGLIGARFEVDKLPSKPLYPNITDDTKMATILLNHYLKGISKNPNKLRALPRGEIVQNFF